MKPFKKFSSLILIVTITASFVIPSFAQTNQGYTPTKPAVSAWAQEEVDRARELGLAPILYEYGNGNQLMDYSLPITRAQYITLAMAYVALQQHSSSGSLEGMVARYLAMGGKDIYSIKEVFTDDTLHASIAYYLGLIERRFDGKFDPQGLITRRQAAVMLTTAYGVCGGKLPDEFIGTGLTDESKLDNWAKPSVLALMSWDVMKCMDDGSFSPEGYFTVEQCIVAFFHLYENAPVSRKNGNVKHLFTYEQAMEYVTKSSNIAEVSLRIDGSSASFIRLDYGGRLRAGSSLCFVYRDGGIMGVDAGVCDEPWGFTPFLQLESPHFSDDGKIFFFTVSIKEDVGNWSQPGGILQEKGIYHMTIDVDTCKHQLQREDLPE